MDGYKFRINETEETRLYEGNSVNFDKGIPRGTRKKQNKIYYDDD